MLSFAEARSLLLGSVTPLAAETAAVSDALGRVLAEAVTAGGPQPPFSYSAMDGYALSSADLRGPGPWQLPVLGESRTGRPSSALEPGAACAISTGAEVPRGADVVVPREIVERTAGSIALREAVRAGQHIRRAGEDLEAGGVALAAGTRLGAASLGLLSALDLTSVQVCRRPRVTVLCTGDELRAPGSPHIAGKIPDSIAPSLRALASSCGAVVRVEPHVGDELDATATAIARALEGTDLLLTVGGMSVGEHDWVRPALEAQGVKLDFWKVAIKPGKPLAFGRRLDGSASVLGLPGNPASAFVTFALFGAPLLRALQGDQAPVPPLLRLKLGAPFRHRAGRLELARSQLRHQGGDWCVVPFENQAAAAQTTLAWADALALIPAEVEELPVGAEVDVIRFQDL